MGDYGSPEDVSNKAVTQRHVDDRVGLRGLLTSHQSEQSDKQVGRPIHIVTIIAVLDLPGVEVRGPNLVVTRGVEDGTIALRVEGVVGDLRHCCDERGRESKLVRRGGGDSKGKLVVRGSPRDMSLMKDEKQSSDRPRETQPDNPSTLALLISSNLIKPLSLLPLRKIVDNRVSSG